MGQDTTKVLMGSTGSSIKEVTNHKGAIDAGLVVHLKSDDTITTAKADGSLLGVSLGNDLSNTDKTAICRKGIRVPVQLTTGFDPDIGAAVAISDTTGKALAYTGSGNSYVNAVYASGRVGGTGVTGGVAEGATGITGTIGVAYIDFPGGL